MYVTLHNKPTSVVLCVTPTYCVYSIFIVTLPVLLLVFFTQPVLLYVTLHNKMLVLHKPTSVVLCVTPTYCVYSIFIVTLPVLLLVFFTQPVLLYVTLHNKMLVLHKPTSVELCVTIVFTLFLLLLYLSCCLFSLLNLSSNLASIYCKSVTWSLSVCC